MGSEGTSSPSNHNLSVQLFRAQPSHPLFVSALSLPEFQELFLSNFTLDSNNASSVLSIMNSKRVTRMKLLMLEVSITVSRNSRPIQLHHVFNLDNDNRAEDTPTLIERRDNVFIISNFKSKYAVLQLDLRTTSTTFPQFGVLVSSWFIARILQYYVPLGITAKLCGGKGSDGVFVGAFLSMSSTAVVLKFLIEKNATNALHGQVTIGTLILQVSTPLFFKLIPALVHIDVLLRWFSHDTSVEIGFKGDNLWSEGGKQPVMVIVLGSHNL